MHIIAKIFFRFIKDTLKKRCEILAPATRVEIAMIYHAIHIDNLCDFCFSIYCKHLLVDRINSHQYPLPGRPKK